jgi:transcriptional regulator with XRE-family HTH domain
MAPDELLRRYPRETLRWLRRRRGLSQLDLGLLAGAGGRSVARWEARDCRILPRYRERLAALLAPHLATPEGEAFLQSLKRGAAWARCMTTSAW